MNDDDIAPASAAVSALPQAEIRARREFSLFWLIPLIAAAIAAWLAFQNYTSRGPEITIVFTRGEGIEAGTTVVRYRAVDVGQVTAVHISTDLKSIEVNARLHPDFAPHLTENTRFWVVRPRIGAKGVSGLSTLVSGAYIEVDPAPGNESRHFTALDSPPIISADAPGRRYVLRARELGNVQPGSPVSFKGFDVGEVLGYALASDGTEIAIHIFVRDPYTELVRENSRFWIASGLNLAIGADGLNFRTPSLQEVLLGGINFDQPSGSHAPVAAAERTFDLYESVEAIAESAFTESIRYVMYFDESVRGLNVGAPVEFRGIKLGRVADVGIEFERSDMKPRIPVVVDLYPQRLGIIGAADPAGAETVIAALLEQGLRARLQTANLLTGQLYVDFTLDPESKAVYVTGKQALPQIPTLPTEFGEFKNNANALLADLRGFPLEEIGDRAIGALAGVESLARDPDIGVALKAAARSLESIERLAGTLESNVTPLREEIVAALAGLREGSALHTRLSETLRQVDAAARSLRLLSDGLERHPEAVIWGKKPHDD